MFETECKDKFGISHTMVKKALAGPLDSQEITYKGLDLLLTTKEIDTSNILIIIANREKNDLSIESAFKLRKDLMKDILIQKPLTIFQHFVEKFGLDIIIGDFSSKFILDETIDINPLQVMNIVNISNPQNHNFLQSMFIKINTAHTQVECAIAFAIDTIEYQAWITIPTN
ncbi:MAG TPA: hypothetical protein VMR41_02655 [Patescibacteria group bacterium]|nr:hypothetical protein [Patescibacteria group bacterium]